MATPKNVDDQIRAQLDALEKVTAKERVAGASPHYVANYDRLRQLMIDAMGSIEEGRLPPALGNKTASFVEIEGYYRELRAILRDELPDDTLSFLRG